MNEKLVRGERENERIFHSKAFECVTSTDFSDKNWMEAPSLMRSTNDEHFHGFFLRSLMKFK